MEEFEDFAYEKNIVSVQCKCGNQVEIDCFSKKDLGEWAWERAVSDTRWKSFIGKHAKEFVGQIVANYHGDIVKYIFVCIRNTWRNELLKIAVACLGKDEIAKRLRKINDVNN